MKPLCTNRFAVLSCVVIGFRVMRCHSRFSGLPMWVILMQRYKKSDSSEIGTPRNRFFHLLALTFANGSVLDSKSSTRYLR
jgi:hypothetical protein